MNNEHKRQYSSFRFSIETCTGSIQKRMKVGQICHQKRRIICKAPL